MTATTLKGVWVPTSENLIGAIKNYAKAPIAITAYRQSTVLTLLTKAVRHSISFPFPFEELKTLFPHVWRELETKGYEVSWRRNYRGGRPGYRKQTIVCEYCDKQKIRYVKLPPPKHQFCRQECYHAWLKTPAGKEFINQFVARQRTGETRICANPACNNEVYISKGRLKRSKRFFCNSKCFFAWMRTPEGRAVMGMAHRKKKEAPP